MSVDENTTFGMASSPVEAVGLLRAELVLPLGGRGADICDISR